MNKDMLARVMRATELTRAGRLADATALIQDALSTAAPGARAAAAAPATPATRGGDVIEGECVEVSASTETPIAAGSAQPDEHTRPRAGLKNLLRKWRHDAAAGPARAAPRADATDAGEFLAAAYTNAAGERAYKVYVPSNYTPGLSLPLIVMLHGCTQAPDDFAAGTRMNRLAEEKHCFVLYPAQSASANHSRCWNWFRREDQTRDRGEPSIIAGMTREVVQRYGIDPGKVYVAGLSAGGAMAAVMAVTYPELYAAVGIHSGLACGSAHDLPSALAAMRGMPAAAGLGAGTTGRSHATPTIVFHGDHDRTVHPRNGADVIAQSTHHAGGRGGQVLKERGQASGGHSYTRTLHRDATGRVVLEQWLVHGGGHAWFGGSAAGSYTDPKGPDASAEMVRFFLDAGLD
ncbi:MAG TPA: PHB depolymerase family esterase [Burkholderiaceae bacterium]|nr:PHB depolymerase family esterase [Burkholderiaceae bacterium]